jgi:ABC-type antimicrobial peptide transport system permease subunit
VAFLMYLLKQSALDISRAPMRTLLIAFQVLLAMVSLLMAAHIVAQQSQLTQLPGTLTLTVNSGVGQIRDVLGEGEVNLLRKSLASEVRVTLYRATGKLLIQNGDKSYKVLNGAVISRGYANSFLSGLEAVALPLDGNAVYIAASVANSVFGQTEGLIGTQLRYRSLGSSMAAKVVKLAGVFADPPADEYGDAAYTVFTDVDPAMFPGTSQAILIKSPINQLAAVRDQIQTLLTKGAKYKLEGTLESDLVLDIQEGNPYSGMLQGGVQPQAILFSLLSFVILCLSVFGVYTSQVVETAERLREISLKRAFGTSKWIIVLERLILVAIMSCLLFVFAIIITGFLLQITQESTRNFLVMDGGKLQTQVTILVFLLMLIVNIVSTSIPVIFGLRRAIIGTIRSSI